MHICIFFYLILVHSNTFQASVMSLMYNLVYQLQCSSKKFCSYNFVLNKMLNNNDFIHIANIVLNKVPNSNDTRYVHSEYCVLVLCCVGGSAKYSSLAMFHKQASGSISVSNSDYTNFHQPNLRRVKLRSNLAQQTAISKPYTCNQP